MEVKRWLAALLAVLGLTGVALALRAFWLEPASLRTTRYEFSLPGWPDSCDGLRVAVLADLHVGSPYNGLDRLERVIDLVRESRPELILLAGDYLIGGPGQHGGGGVVGGRFVPPEAIAASLHRLAAPLGVWAVLGNHDLWFDGSAVATAFEAAGIHVVDDRATAVRGGRCDFWLAGISDYSEGRHDVGRALAQVIDSAPVLAFTHNPDVFPQVPARVSLTIAGHTHGGQVDLPLLGRLVVPSRYRSRYALGHIVEGGRHLFVSSGIGTSILPVRFRVPPEVSVLTLRSAPAAAASR